MWQTSLQLFVIGLTFSLSGPCLFICVPILLTFIAGSKENSKSGLLETLSFLFARVFAYTILGLLAGSSAKLLNQFFFHSSLGFYLRISISLFICLLGLLIVLGKMPIFNFCQAPRAHLVERGTKSMFLLGFLLGFSPCPPLIALLGEVVLISQNAFQGAFYAASFGLGTLVSPLLVLGPLAGYLPSKLKPSPKSFTLFRILCGLLLLGLGIQQIV